MPLFASWPYLCQDFTEIFSIAVDPPSLRLTGAQHTKQNWRSIQASPDVAFAAIDVYQVRNQRVS